MKTFPTLYKKTSTGAIQEWTIGVFQASMNSKEATIETVYGQLNSDKIQTTQDIISSGKNIGKKNETTAFEQADFEAKAKWEKQKKKGYVESIEAAKSDELDALIEGGIVPMLAQKFTDHAHKIKYPCYVQPKLDGIRCIAIVKDGVCTLWSRTRKRITGVPHIAHAIEASFTSDIILDGELYNHDYKSNFEKIVSFVRQETPADGHEVVQYHIYDLISEDPFETRSKTLFDNFVKIKNKPLKWVLTVSAQDEEEVMINFDLFRQKGYEGAMVRNSDSKYVNKRSYDLQKVKEFDDSEFDIIGIEEGRGKLSGHAIFVCKTESGTEFLAKMKGDTIRLKEFFDDHSLWKGKKLTVKYQGLTGANGVPRFPIGISIRDYE